MTTQSPATIDEPWTHDPLNWLAIVLFAALLISLGAASIPAAWVRNIGKSALGPFVGAGLAFASTMLIQRHNRRRDNLCAGNLALATISIQYNEFLAYRRSLRIELHRRNEASPGAPAWILAPVIAGSGVLRTLDFRSLAFLLDRPRGIDVHNRLVLAEQHYEAIRSIFERLATNVQEIQRETASSGLTSGTHAEFERRVGVDRTARTADMLLGAIAETQAEANYLNAFNDLRVALVRVFGRGPLPRSMVPMPGRADAELPPLPPHLVQQMHG